MVTAKLIPPPAQTVEVPVTGVRFVIVLILNKDELEVIVPQLSVTNTRYWVPSIFSPSTPILLTVSKAVFPPLIFTPLTLEKLPRGGADCHWYETVPTAPFMPTENSTWFP